MNEHRCDDFFQTNFPVARSSRGAVSPRKETGTFTPEFSELIIFDEFGKFTN
jgi:hypothetical protein